MATVLVTGVAGFIGSWTAEALVKRGDTVIGIDDFNDYYDPSLKRARVKKFGAGVRVYEINLSDIAALDKVFRDNKITQVCHMAAQAGVRYSLSNPFIYEQTNNLGTLALLEQCRKNSVQTFVFASSSSVYGGNKKIPFVETDNVDRPISFYAATKRFNELVAHTYHHLHGIHCTGLRFFTVYGPWGRPDMAYYKFTKAISEEQSIDVYNHGRMKRDFTYITDIVNGVLAALDKNYPYEIFNLGNSKTIELTSFIHVLEKEIGKEARKKYLGMQPGDVPETYADITKAREKLDFLPKIEITDGIRRFIEWYKVYSAAPLL